MSPARRTGLAVLPKTLSGRIQRLRAICSEAGELTSWLTSQLKDYERELLISALCAARGNEFPRATSAPKRPPFESRIRRLQAITDDVTSLIQDLVEDLGARLEAYQREPFAAPAAPGLKAQVEEYERKLILSALRACGMNQLLASHRLGVLPTTLNEKIKRLGLRKLYVPSSDPPAGPAPRIRRTSSLGSLPEGDAPASDAPGHD